MELRVRPSPELHRLVVVGLHAAACVVLALCGALVAHRSVWAGALLAAALLVGLPILLELLLPSLGGRHASCRSPRWSRSARALGYVE